MGNRAGPLEGMGVVGADTAMNNKFWQGKKVFLTGHTGFKGSWLGMWLTLLGAEVTGYALQPPTQPNLYEICKMAEVVTSVIGDIRDGEALPKAMSKARPEIVIHLAAQPLVLESYRNPAETYAVNVMGTVTLLEAVRGCDSVRAVINVTTDKCYANREWVWGYREIEPMGGYDPYSSSKACSELITEAYRNSFFNIGTYEQHGVGLASARAGNVIGGGDWAADRLIPDCIKALLNHEKIIIRNPHAVRPWQHVLEPLSGYLLLAQNLYENGVLFAEGWNFGPDDSDAQTVAWIVEKLCAKWGSNAAYEVNKAIYQHEAHYLKLDCSKARTRLKWQTRWDLEQALGKIIEWIDAYKSNSDMRAVCSKQINEYVKA